MVTVLLQKSQMDKIGFWNVRGMNRVGKQKAINFFLQNKDIRLFGLLETKIKSRALKKVVNNFNNWCISTNNGHHNGGRIWILWQPQAVKIQFLEYNAQFIHMRVESVENRSIFYMTMVYAFNSITDRAPLWDHLRRIASQCVADCGVIDSDATGSLFTWNNKQKPEERIYSRIDRFLINKDWCDHLPDLYAHFLPEGLMDHTPLLKRLNKEGYTDIEHSTNRLQRKVHELQEQIGKNPTDAQLLAAEFEASQELKN
ncbi:uncharacterized protein LOC141629388 [Silene latifolia]|uniref:uncharacterized protein LOC141629388 n=1 Tax=Silene latifolia TaxID=37657 RepID=UPI003D7746D5